MFSDDFINTYPIWFMVAGGIICVIILIVCARLSMDPFYCVLAAFNPFTAIFAWMLVCAPLTTLGVLLGCAVMYGLACVVNPSISKGE